VFVTDVQQKTRVRRRRESAKRVDFSALPSGDTQTARSAIAD
jgi:hypothetical protein